MLLWVLVPERHTPPPYLYLQKTENGTGEKRLWPWEDAGTMAKGALDDMGGARRGEAEAC